MSRNVYGIDFGTYEIKVYDKKQKTIWTEKNAIALTERDEIFAVGDEAYEMYGKTPPDLRVIFPMKEGVIAEWTPMERLMRSLLKKGRQFAGDSVYLLAIPGDITQVERRAFRELFLRSAARAREVWVVERGIADAVGAGLELPVADGQMIVNLGSETTELSVLKNQTIVCSKLVRSGGAGMTEAIAERIKAEHRFCVSRRDAAALRDRIGLCGEEDGKEKKRSLRAGGKKMSDGLPKYEEISASLVADAVRGYAEVYLREIRTVLDRLPPELQRTVRQRGILLTGGLGVLPGLMEYLADRIGIPVTAAADAGLCVVNGLKKIILTRSLRDLAYEMSDGNDRWMR